MSAKYQTHSNARILVDTSNVEYALTDHAIDQWHKRMPVDRTISIRGAWHQGEMIKHPSVCDTDAESTDPPDAIRVFNPDCSWSAVFVCVEGNHSAPVPEVGSERQFEADRTIVTTCRIRTYEHGPTRAYLHSHGPHEMPERPRRHVGGGRDA